jgi:hypothetical protein
MCYFKFIRDNSDKPWDWVWISCNPNITMEIIKNNPDKHWNWAFISGNLFAKDKDIFNDN